MAGYFIRFVADEAQAKRDQKVGHSYSGYMSFATRKEAAEWQQDMNWRGEIERCSDKQYRFALAGLCGFGIYNDAEEAEQAFIAGAHAGYGGGNLVTIWEGTHVGESDMQDGDLFLPTRLVKMFKRA